MYQSPELNSAPGSGGNPFDERRVGTFTSSFADKPLPAMGSMSRDQVSQMVVSDLYGMCGARKEINASAQALARRHEYKSRKSGSMTVFGESSGSIVW